MACQMIQDTDELSLTFNNDAHLNSRVKRFGKSSLEVAAADFVESTSVPDQLNLKKVILQLRCL